MAAITVITLISTDTDLAALMPLQNRMPAHEPIGGQPCFTEPHPGSDSVLQQMVAIADFAPSRQRRSPGASAHISVKAVVFVLPLVAAGCLLCEACLLAHSSFSLSVTALSLSLLFLCLLSRFHGLLVACDIQVQHSSCSQMLLLYPIRTRTA